MDECRFSKALQSKVKTTAAWLAEHKDHGGITIHKADHPGGKWVWRKCVCGAKHLSSGKEPTSGEEKDSP